MSPSRGVITFMGLRDGFPARAAATFRTFSDLAAYFQGDPRARQYIQRVWPDSDLQSGQILAKRSAIQWPDGGFPL